MGEFDLIARFFQRNAHLPPGVDLGIGDDCALLGSAEPASGVLQAGWLGAGMQLAVSTDMLVEGRHFLSTVDPARLGHKALAVNLSDLAACGAVPKAFTLSLALPRVDTVWLEGFSRGLFALADMHGCTLIGGDTTQGPLTISITVLGEVPRGQALLRSGAVAGDDIYVSGTKEDCVGDARLALEIFRGHAALPDAVLGAIFQHVRNRMESPTPRVALGQALRGVASSAIDVSDGLLGDLQHILKQSGVGATVDMDTDFHTNTTKLIANYSIDTQANLVFSSSQWQTLRFAGGDDYELVFTAAPAQRERVQQVANATGTVLTRIGCIDALTGLRLVDAHGQRVANTFASFDHFV